MSFCKLEIQSIHFCHVIQESIDLFNENKENLANTRQVYMFDRKARLLLLFVYLFFFEQLERSGGTQSPKIPNRRSQSKGLIPMLPECVLWLQRRCLFVLLVFQILIRIRFGPLLLIKCCCGCSAVNFWWFWAKKCGSSPSAVDFGLAHVAVTAVGAVSATTKWAGVEPQQHFRAFCFVDRDWPKLVVLIK